MTRDCPVCCVPHDESIHAATLRLRAWLREQVRLTLRPRPEAEPRKERG
jgi:hypothetical protein